MGVQVPPAAIQSQWNPSPAYAMLQAMSLLRVATADLNQTPLAWDTNKSHILGAIAEAKSNGVTLLCLPELCVSGYGCEDTFLSEFLADTSMEMLQDVLPATQGMVVAIGLPYRYETKLYNVAALAVDGRLAGLVGKRFLAKTGLHYEPRWFEAWPADKVVSVKVGQASIPLGDILFDVGNIRIGFEICEDAWVADRRALDLSKHSVNVILNPSASHFAFGKFNTRQQLVLEASKQFQVAYLYANHLGNESGRIIYDGGGLIAQNGEWKAKGMRFSFKDWKLTIADIARPLSSPKTKASAIAVDFSWPTPSRPAPIVSQASWEQMPFLKEEEFARAEALGLFDYLRKSGSQGFAISLSGGADSCATAVLVNLMARLGSAELGLESFWKKLLPGAKGKSPDKIEELMKRILVCVYQATKNSGNETRNSARAVADAVGADWHLYEIQHLVDGYVDLVSKSEGRRLTWETDDLALQNVQARVRSPSIWLLANIRKFLLLTTSNRSEASVGYATMDGDTSGGLSPLGGIDKNFLRKWLRWMEVSGPDEKMAIPVLSLVNQLAPTAELRPPSSGQTDESDLMPYAILAEIERLAIRDKLSPLRVWHELKKRASEVSSVQLGKWVERFFALWCRNQWKRERYAPAFHLDDQSVDPKTWCRFPILSGNYERELQQLRRAYQA